MSTVAAFVTWFLIVTLNPIGLAQLDIEWDDGWRGKAAYVLCVLGALIVGSPWVLIPLVSQTTGAILTAIDIDIVTTVMKFPAIILVAALPYVAASILAGCWWLIRSACAAARTPDRDGQ